MGFEDGIEGEKIFPLSTIRSVAQRLHTDYTAKHLGEAYCWEYTKSIIDELGGTITKNLIELSGRDGGHWAAKFQTENGEFAVDITFLQFSQRFKSHDLPRQTAPVIMPINQYLDLMRKIEYTLDGTNNIRENRMPDLPERRIQSPLKQSSQPFSSDFSGQIKDILNL